MSQWKVHKFGGTSVLNAERIRNVAQIILQDAFKGRVGVVVSAMKGTTDDLIACTEKASQQQALYKEILENLHSRHIKEAESLLKADSAAKYIQMLKKDFADLAEILRSVWLLRAASLEIVEYISGMGEVWSAQLLNAHFNDLGHNSHWIDAREILTVSRGNPHVMVDWQASTKEIQEFTKNYPSNFFVITGFVAKTHQGIKTTLGRNGSDYSATIFGVLLKAQEIIIWTDVDGILSADPRLVPEAHVLDEMSYNEVSELAYFGAKVVHPATMYPAVENKIPVWIRNSLNPSHKGTLITEKSSSTAPVKGFSTIDKMALVNIEGPGMVGIPGVSEKIFSTLRANKISVVLISQASSEQSICFAIAEAQAPLAEKVISEAFATEIQQRMIKAPEVTKSVSIIAVVGDNMAHSPGLAGRFFSALGRSSINVRAIAQGSSERNISAVIDTSDSVRALRNVHSAFYLSNQVISLGLIGPGQIGKVFLQQLHAESTKLLERQNLVVQVRGIMNSKRMLLSDKPIDLTNWQSEFETKSVPADVDTFVKHVKSNYLPHSVIVECTASSDFPDRFTDWMKQGLHIITPNKRANTRSLNDYIKLRETAKAYHRHFLYSTNVGAGLPMIQTVKDLFATGDEILDIEGILSGTLSYIFNEVGKGQKFSEVVKKAKEKGFTEPDPREDLSGEDMMRKFVILARESGRSLDIQEVKLVGLVPDSLKAVSVEQFMGRLTEMDSVIHEKADLARKNGEQLRFTGRVLANGEAVVGLHSYPETHPFCRLTGNDNILMIRSRRYYTQPLIIQGPGAGPEVTAAGVFADLLRLASYLGPKQ